MRPDWKMHTRQNGIPVSLDLGGNWNHIVGGEGEETISMTPLSPPTKGSWKAKRKGERSEGSILYFAITVWRNSHIWKTQYEMQRKHFESANLSQMSILLLFLSLKVKHNRKCVKMHVIPLTSIMLPIKYSYIYYI